MGRRTKRQTARAVLLVLLCILLAGTMGALLVMDQRNQSLEQERLERIAEEQAENLAEEE